MGQVIDYMAKKKERDIDALTEAYAKEEIDFNLFFNAYMNMIYSNDDGINAQITFEMMFDD